MIVIEKTKTPNITYVVISVDRYENKFMFTLPEAEAIMNALQNLLVYNQTNDKAIITKQIIDQILYMKEKN